MRRRYELIKQERERVNALGKRSRTAWQPKGLLRTVVVADFPGGPVVKNSPASAGDKGSTPGPGRFYVTGGNQAHKPQLLSPCSGAHSATREAPAVRNLAPK